MKGRPAGLSHSFLCLSKQMNKAVFGFTEVKLGLVPAVISPFVMMKIGHCFHS